MRQAIVDLLETRFKPLHAFWTSGEAMPAEASSEAHCDLVYSLVLLGRPQAIHPMAVERFIEHLARANLPGWKPRGDAPVLSVHNCAYAFGALNLAAPDKAAAYERVLAGRELDLAQIVDPATHRPVFPQKWAHHNWRVSHWIGGVPSLILSIARSGSSHADRFAALVGPVRDATDGLIAANTGLLHAYSNEIIQSLFRILYAFRHDPTLGDVGGVAHILWVDHVIHRPYVGLDALVSQSRVLFEKHTPFMETVPYCLDFDIVQIVRTAGEQRGQISDRDRRRAEQMMRDLEAFFAKGAPDGYTLHKIPGALATYHECALITGSADCGVLEMTPVDIIKSAYWL